MRLLRYLQEKYLARIGTSEIFVNPSKKDITDLQKVDNMVRFFIDPEKGKVYAWQSGYIHSDVMDQLKVDNRGWSYETIHKYITGHGRIRSGKIVMLGSDEIDYQLKQAIRGGRQALELIDKWRWIWEDIDSYKFAFRFIDMKKWVDKSYRAFEKIDFEQDNEIFKISY